VWKSLWKSILQSAQVGHPKRVLALCTHCQHGFFCGRAFQRKGSAAALISKLVLPFLIVAFLTSCVSRQRPNIPSTPATAPVQANSNHSINVNHASVEELETLPGIGPTLAERIIEHRQKYGPFKRAEHVLMVRGFSEKLYHRIQGLITVEEGGESR
jgi:competence ComEA-like helix-hairpin-helix protein